MFPAIGSIVGGPKGIVLLLKQEVEKEIGFKTDKFSMTLDLTKGTIWFKVYLDAINWRKYPYEDGGKLKTIISSYLKGKLEKGDALDVFVLHADNDKFSGDLYTTKVTGERVHQNFEI